MVKMDSSKRKSSPVTHEEVLLMKKMKTDSPHILDFSDCVLTLILSYLDSYDLYRLSKTCSRFKYLIEERKLWKRLDIISHPMCAKKFAFFFENVNNMTDTVMLSGISRKEKTLTSMQIHKLFNICDNLSILAIENQYINSDEVRLNQFPKGLKELSLRGTHITGKQQFLQDAHKKLAHLHTLILDDCKWLHEHSLMALSKLPSLENLSLYNCRNLNDSVAYMSVTARFGFTKLLRIDARCTPIGDQFLKCFHCVKTLREIYLESPPICPNKRGSLFEEIKRWCTSNMQAVPNVVIFNQSTVNTVFKRNRNIKRAKKSKSEPSSPILKPLHIFDPNFNCLENCESCSIETCGSFMSMEKFLTDEITSHTSKKTEKEKEHKSKTSRRVERSEQNEINNCQGSSKTSNKVENNTKSNDNTEKDGSSINQDKIEHNESTDNDNTISDKSVEENKPKEADKPEILYCDDVSDSEDEMMEFQMFHSDVTDAGVQWFCSSDPQSVDAQGSESMLFKKPYKKCDCEHFPPYAAPSLDISEPGPSGLNQPGPSVPPDNNAAPLQNNAPRRPPNFFQDNPRRRVVFKRKKCRITEPPNNTDAKRVCPDKPSITVDLNIGEGPLHLEIINEITGTIQRAPEIEEERNESNSDTDDKSNGDKNEEKVNEEEVDSSEESCETCESPELERSPLRRREPTPPPPREEEEMRNRDLRVIIERLDPGLHIVIDRAGRIQFGPMRANNYTKLKVFMARGYKMITDQALRSLSDLRLELLDVTGTSVTPTGIQQFLMVNPDCRVIHESICSCG